MHKAEGEACTGIGNKVTHFAKFDGGKTSYCPHTYMSLLSLSPLLRLQGDYKVLPGRRCPILAIGVLMSKSILSSRLIYCSEALFVMQMQKESEI